MSTANLNPNLTLLAVIFTILVGRVLLPACGGDGDGESPPQA